jgi:ABC-type multidrug transport system ATPase subunit
MNYGNRLVASYSFSWHHSLLRSVHSSSIPLFTAHVFTTIALSSIPYIYTSSTKGISASLIAFSNKTYYITRRSVKLNCTAMLHILKSIMTNTIIKTTGLSYSYAKAARTLSDINLVVEQGSIYGFLGPNGSGKTTTLSLLLGLLTNQQGSIEIFGKDIRRHRIEVLRNIGSLIEAPSIYGHLTAKENLEVYRPVYGVKKERITEVLKTVGLEDTGKKTAKKFSLGMKQRLAIALALLPAPRLLILDEPTNGLDPAGIIELRQLLKQLNQQHGITILISSHILSEVEKMVSHLGIIYQGKMLFQGTLPQLHTFQQRDARLCIHTSDNAAAYTLLDAYKPQNNGEMLEVSFSGIEQAAAINRTLVQHGIDVYQLTPVETDLEQLFINLTTDAA